MRKQGKATKNVLTTKIISQLLPKLKKQSDTPSLLSLWHSTRYWIPQCCYTFFIEVWL